MSMREVDINFRTSNVFQSGPDVKRIDHRIKDVEAAKNQLLRADNGAKDIDDNEGIIDFGGQPSHVEVDGHQVTKAGIFHNLPDGSDYSEIYFAASDSESAGYITITEKGDRTEINKFLVNSDGSETQDYGFVEDYDSSVTQTRSQYTGNLPLDLPTLDQPPIDPAPLALPPK